MSAWIKIKIKSRNIDRNIRLTLTVILVKIYNSKTAALLYNYYSLIFFYV